MDRGTEGQIITVPPSGGPILHPTHSGVTGAIVGTGILSAWIIFANLVILIALITSERRRKISFNLHVINHALINLVMGGLVLPLYIDFEMKGRWEHSDNVCRLWLVSDLMVCSVSVAIVGMIVFDRFVLFSCTSIAERGGKYIFAAAVFIIPWGLAAAFVIPVYLSGETGSGVDASNGVCYLNLNTTYSILLVIGGYFVPALASFGILVAMTLTWCVRKGELTEMDWIEELKDKGWQVLMSWIMLLAVLGMWLPFNFLYLIIYLVDTTWPFGWLEPAMWIAYANAGLTPLLWILMPSVRESVTRMVCCCCCKPKENRNNSNRRQTNFRQDAHNDDASVSMLDFKMKNKH